MPHLKMDHGPQIKRQRTNIQGWLHRTPSVKPGSKMGVTFSPYLPIPSSILMTKVLRTSHRCKHGWNFNINHTNQIFWEGSAKLGKFDQTWHCLRKQYLFKIKFCVITWARIKLETWNLVKVCRTKLRKLIESTTLILLFSLLLLNLIYHILQKIFTSQ